MRISSPAANVTSRSSGRDEHVHRRRRAAASRSTRSGDPVRDVVERIDVEVRAQLAIDHVQHVAVELRRHAARVVVGRHQAAGPSRGRCRGATPPRARAARDVGEEAARCSAEVADGTSRGRRPSAAARRAACRGDARSRRRRRDAMPGTVGDRSAASREGLLANIQRDERLRCPARRIASSSSRVFSDDPEPSSTSGSPPAARAIHRPAQPGSSRSRPRQVVLRQPRDLLEQLEPRAS